MKKISAFLLAAGLLCGAALLLARPVAAQPPNPVTPSTTPGPGLLPFTWGVDTEADLPVGPHRLGLCMSAWDTGQIWCWSDGGAWTAQAGGGGGGGGTVTSFTLTSIPWLTVTGSTSAVVVAPTSAQTAGRVVGTCGAGTTVSLCALTAGMVPTLNQSTTGNAGTATQLAAAPANCSSGQGATGINAAGVAQGCTSYVQPGVDVNSSNQVTATHLASALPVVQGGTGVTSLPACVDTGGNHLNFNAGVWSCGTTSGASGLGGASGSVDRGLLVANGTGGSTAQGVGSGNAVFNTTGVFCFGPCDGTHPGIGYFVNPQTNLVSLGTIRGDGAALLDLVTGAITITDDSGVGKASIQGYVDPARSEFTFSNSWLLGWSAGGNNPFANADTSMNRGKAGQVSVNAGRSSDGSGSVKLTTVQYVPTSGVTCNSGAKGLTYVASGDGSFCSCNGTSWTAMPITGTCN